ncbi:FtsX-like permease family protein [Candidatus Woesearchaeota archaeon]|nr:FtsX-like permease family protein [Candidatus Woesearchaeota archaeon]
MIRDYVLLSLSSLRSRRMRSWLTMIGIVIGMSAVVSLISLGQGMQDSINDQFQRLGTNRLIIAPGGEFLGPGTADIVAPIMDDSDVDVIRNVKGITQVQGALSKTLKVEFKDEIQFDSIFAFETDSDAVDFVESVGLFDIAEGRELKSGDKYKAVLGYNVANEAFDDPIEVGRKILLDDIEFEVVGVQKLIGTGIHDGVIRIPQDTLRELTDEPRKLSMIFALTQPDLNPVNVKAIVERELRKHRDVKEGEEDFNVQTAEQTIGQLNTVLLAVQVVLVGIAAISLLVGGIGVMNTMYTSVLERTKEIGIMKSIGARNSHVLTLFLLESGMLGLVGGLMGLGLGLGVAKLGEYLAIGLGASFFRMHISTLLIVGTLMFSFVLGMFSGAFPARQAARLPPVEALRSIK